jgi:hypothetical protein
MAMAMRMMKGGPSVAGSFARLCAVSGVSGRYSTAAAASATTTTVTKIITTPAGHGTVVAHGTRLIRQSTFTQNLSNFLVKDYVQVYWRTESSVLFHF